MEKSKNKKLHEKLFWKRNSAWDNSKDKKSAYDFAEKYKSFLATSKTEREATKTILAGLITNGFKDILKISKLKPGDKVYLNQKGKSVVAAIIGKENNKFNLVGSHIDSPRLDLKPNPLTEEDGIALLKTHYYGGIKKYQWTNVDLALYGVIYTKSGKKIDLKIGEKDGEPRFIVSDLLPHLAKKQMEKQATEVVQGEQLNVFLGNVPIEGNDVKDAVKLNVLNILNKDYGIIEEDFSFAELTFVPAGKPTDIGFDMSMVAAYGQDDKSCSYANYAALLAVKNPKITAVAYFSDKEEIGSLGNTGAQSFILLDFAEYLVEKLSLKVTANYMLRNSRAISADVGAALDPNFSEVHEKRNAAHLGCGVVIEKYTGAGGKYNANDTHAEYLNDIRKILQDNNIAWQTGELGKIDLGGGGTIAMYLSRFGMDTVDAGPAILGMHAPRDVLSKIDLYQSFKLYKAFFES